MVCRVSPARVSTAASRRVRTGRAKIPDARNAYRAVRWLVQLPLRFFYTAQARICSLQRKVTKASLDALKQDALVINLRRQLAFHAAGRGGRSNPGRARAVPPPRHSARVARGVPASLVRPVARPREPSRGQHKPRKPQQEVEMVEASKLELSRMGEPDVRAVDFRATGCRPSWMGARTPTPPRVKAGLGGDVLRDRETGPPAWGPWWGTPQVRSDAPNGASAARARPSPLPPTPPLGSSPVGGKCGGVDGTAGRPGVQGDRPPVRTPTTDILRRVLYEDTPASGGEVGRQGEGGREFRGSEQGPGRRLFDDGCMFAEEGASSSRGSGERSSKEPCDPRAGELVNRDQSESKLGARRDRSELGGEAVGSKAKAIEGGDRGRDSFFPVDGDTAWVVGGDFLRERLLRARQDFATLKGGISPSTITGS